MYTFNNRHVNTTGVEHALWSLINKGSDVDISFFFWSGNHSLTFCISYAICVTVFNGLSFKSDKQHVPGLKLDSLLIKY